MLVIVLRSVLFIACLLLSACKPLQILQQSSYRASEFLLSYKNKPIYSIFSVSFFAIGIIAVFVNIWVACGFSVIYSVVSIVFYRKNLKKPLVFTKRVVRLLIAYAVFVIAFAIIQIFITQVYALVFCSVLILLFANFVCKPIEKRIAQGFLIRAEDKIRRINPTVIAITGSYGKTSLKNILAQILSTQYKVCASPKSYNTPMGLARCINENLKDGDRIFIAEAGARYRGDIGEICRFINPKIAVITAIGNQHLSTFKTLKNLQNEKFSIITDSVESVFINGDTVKDILPIPKDKLVTVSGKNGTVKYDEVYIENEEQKFVVYAKNTYTIKCSLLADYMPSTITLALAIAESLGISQKNIKNSINNLKPIAHRLEILYNDKDVIIDDAYNSNESGFISAINLVSSYKNKIKIVITPGVVELGKRQSEINMRLASYAYERVDYLFTYGINAEAIKRGAGDKCEICSSLDECMKRYKSIQGERVVLFENDLPDTY